MARSERPNEGLSENELDAFEDGLGDLEQRVTDFLAETTDRTPEQVDAAIDEHSLPDPLDDEPLDETED